MFGMIFTKEKASLEWNLYGNDGIKSKIQFFTMFHFPYSSVSNCGAGLRAHSRWAEHNQAKDMKGKTDLFRPMLAWIIFSLL